MTMERHSKPRRSQLAQQTTAGPAKPVDNNKARQKAKSSFDSCKNQPTAWAEQGPLCLELPIATKR